MIKKINSHSRTEILAIIKGQQYPQYNYKHLLHSGRDHVTSGPKEKKIATRINPDGFNAGLDKLL